MPLRSLRRTVATLVRIAVFAVLVASTAALPVGAQVGVQVDALESCDADERVTLADHTWRTVVDVDHAFAVRIPPAHAIVGGNGTWYVHGFLDGAPLAPDVAISFLPGVTIEEVVARDFPTDSVVDRIELGPATSGARVHATYAAADGSTYRQASYLATTERGVLRVDRYEGVDWDGFDAVACSIHALEVAR